MHYPTDRITQPRPLVHQSWSTGWNEVHIVIHYIYIYIYILFFFFSFFLSNSNVAFGLSILYFLKKCSFFPFVILLLLILSYENVK